MAKAFLVFVALCAAVTAATLYGTVYDEDYFPTKAQVTLNSTPPQVAVSANGSYAFELANGDYVLNAAWGNHTAQKNVSIVQNGQYRIDVILLPQDPASDPTLGDILDDGIGAALLDEASPSGIAVWLAVLGVAILGVAAWHLRKQPQPPLGPAASPQKDAPAPLTDAEKTVLSTLDTFNGRASQKELRKALSQWSEAKVSMELTELQDKGLIRKIKRGRGNIIRKNP
ncbi:MAG: hypothetical protein Q8P02_05375 [Candidatus Micrarchaeota archaeon]|nr:hypothetical protein [Candidatus Micrarchaeota archaeon]